MTVKIVVDSLADLPAEQVERHGIEIIPLTVRFGTTEFKDGVDLTADDFYQRLAAGHDYPATAVPSIGEFVEMYERVGRDADGIISIPVSSKVSGTYNAAVQAKGEVDVGGPIEVIDTYQASMGVGMVAISAAKAAREGADLEEVTRVAGQSVERSQCISLFDTLEYLQKGGRIGKARALLGTLLKIRPMIILRDGEVHEFGKERARARGVAKLESTAREYGPLRDLSVLHTTTPDDAEALAKSLSDLLPSGTDPVIARAGPVIGTYAGPGCLAIALLQAESAP